MKTSIFNLILSRINKHKRMFAVAMLSLFSLPMLAQGANPAEVNLLTTSTGMLLLLLVVILLGVIIYQAYLISSLADEIKSLEENKEGKVVERATFWQKIAGLKPMSQEKDLIIEGHEYDGIRELNNHMPPWLQVLFYITILFSIVYFIYYRIMDGPDQFDEYKSEVAAAEKLKEAKAAKGDALDENTVTLADAAGIENGKKIYNTNCVPCHGDKGQGGIGPNLTDEYWIHGGGIKNVFKTIKYGVSEKGMQSWKQQLTPVQIQEVASYILSLKGTNPPNAKEPQGEKYVEEGTTSAKTDSIATKKDTLTKK